MRSFIFLFCATVFGFTSSGTLSQNVKIIIDENKEVSVDEVFDLIMDQTDITFIYKADMFKDFPKVSLKKGSVRVNHLLSQSLSQGDFNFDIKNDNTIIIRKNSIPINVQEIVVSGTVIDRNGMPIAGLSVYTTDAPTEDNSNVIRGTTTDFDGKFKLNVSIGDFIIVTGIGFQRAQTMVKSGETVYNFVLKEDVNELEEIVVTGYQKISRERSTGAFNVVPKEQIQNTATQNIGSVLQGIAPGIQVVEDADGNIDINDVVIRGVGSIDPNSSTAPLVVVDGFPIQGGFDTINPNDIESVTILKDAAAASIWGARAGNGVIVVVTKKSSRKGMNINFSSFIKMKPKMNLERNITRADSKTTLDFESTIWTPTGHGTQSIFFVSNNHPAMTLFDRNIVASSGRSYSQGARAYYDAWYGHITQAELNTKINRLSGINSFDDIEKYVLTAPIQNQYNLALSTSSDRSSTRVSALFNDNVNAFIGDENEQILINVNNQYKISDWLTFNFNGMLDNSRDENRGIGFGTVQNMSPYQNLINADGSYANVKHPIYDPKYLEYFGNNVVDLPYDDITYNPLRDARGTESVSKHTNYRINVGLNIKLLDGLVFKPSYQYEKFQTKNEIYRGPETSTVKFAVINGSEVANYDPVAGTIGPSNVPLGAILDGSSSESTGYTIRTLLNYDKTFNKHGISALAGYERISSTSKGLGGIRTYGFNRETNQFAVPSVTSWESLWGQGGVLDGRFFSQSDRRFVSYFGNAAYTYDNKYTVTGSARSDGANFIVEDKAMRFNPMWSVGLSWNAKNENFLKDVDFINSLKFRVTNGENGNLVGSSATTPTISVSQQPNFYTGVYTAFLQNLGNPELRWERINTLNFGLDFNIFNSKLYGSIDVYNKGSEDLIATIDVPSTTGLTYGTFNVGEMSNKGVELNLSSDILFSENVKLNTNLVFSHNNSEVTKLADFSIFPRALPQFPYVEGRPYNAVHSFVYGGMRDIPSQTKPYPTIIGENGVIYGMDENIGLNGEDGRDVLKYQGTLVAPTILGWNNTFNYQNFTFTTRFIGKFGHKFRRPTHDYTPTRNRGVYHKDLEGLVAGRHDEMGLPYLDPEWDLWSYRISWYVPYLNTIVEDASHIRLRQIYLSYDLPSNLLSKIGLSNLRLFAQAENLGNIWVANDYNIDPEYINGITRAPEKTFTLGLNIEF
ncbi:SusC/RagA family TonB-linked outer membrane protein [Snuella lapsa]|uniref:SusC/RagA family TonB-linked outer membrane protein n=2 Tax=Snuella lapsa TaxID=870481 RepID=A0ABP6XWJ3_9FLAO